MHYFFVVIDEHESVIIIGLKVKQCFCDVEKVQIGRLSKKQYTICRPTVFAQVPVILFFWTCSSQISKRRVGA